MWKSWYLYSSRWMFSPIYSPCRSWVSIGHHQLVIGMELIDFSDRIKLWFVLFKQFEENIFFFKPSQAPRLFERFPSDDFSERLWVFLSISVGGGGGPSCAVSLLGNTIRCHLWYWPDLPSAHWLGGEASDHPIGPPATADTQSILCLVQI